MRGEEGERGRGQSHRRPTPRVHTSNHGKRRTTTLKPYSFPIHNRMWRKMGEGAAGLWQGVRGPSSRASCGTASGLPGCHRRHGFPSMFACGAGWIGPASGATLGSALGRPGATSGGCIGGGALGLLGWVGYEERAVPSGICFSPVLVAVLHHLPHIVGAFLHSHPYPVGVNAGLGIWVRQATHPRAWGAQKPTV